MTSAMRENDGTSKQRGFWLRYFLGAAICLAVMCGAERISAQIDIPGPERLSHVSGIVVDPVGHRMADLKISLLQDDKLAYETQTDAQGRFKFEHVRAGAFTLRIDRTKFAPASRQIVVTDEVVTYLERKKLYVILGPAQCEDACSAVLTSKKEFDREVRKNNRHQ